MFSHLTFLSRKRRSVREYANQPIDSEVLKDILEAGLRAPTSKNSRSTRFFVVEDKQLLKDFSECRERGSQFLSGAPVAIVVCSDSNKSKRPYSDCAIAASFIQLAVTDHDLGSCWCHIEDSPSPKGATAEEYIKYKLDLPDSYKVLCIIGIGEVAKADMLKPREREVEWERLFVGRYEEREL
nr:nitroreductase family protein [uncultured Porphyromonas sp.]